MIVGERGRSAQCVSFPDDEEEDYIIAQKVQNGVDVGAPHLSESESA
jgi:hypothetical protein